MSARGETSRARVPIATAKVWEFGGTWTVHAKHPDSKAWIRVTGIPSEGQAIVEGDALCWTLDREADANGWSTVTRARLDSPSGAPKGGSESGAGGSST